MALSPSDELVINAITDQFVDKVRSIIMALIIEDDDTGHLADAKLLLFTAIQQALELNNVGTQGPQSLE